MAETRPVTGPRPGQPLDARTASLDLQVLALVVARLVATLRVAEALAADRRDLEAGRFYAITDAGRAALAGAR